jgi:hypothetical protein
VFENSEQASLAWSKSRNRRICFAVKKCEKEAMYRKPELLIEWTQNPLGKMFALMLIGQELGDGFYVGYEAGTSEVVRGATLAFVFCLPLWVLLYPNLPSPNLLKHIYMDILI